MDSGNNQNLIEMQAASLDFGRGTGVFDLTFNLSAGTILGFIGPSGCGKTTTMRLLTGIYESTAGLVRVFGKNPVNFQDADKARIGYLPQHFILYQYLSAEENLHFMGGMYGMSLMERRARIDRLLDFLDLHAARKRLGRHLSGGMQRRLMLAGALLHNPELIFADEPTAGIDPILRSRIWQNFHQLRDDGHTLLVTTQYVGEAAFCDLVAVMCNGRLVTIDAPQALRRKAMGGDIIHLQAEADTGFLVMEYLDSLPQVKKVERVKDEQDGMYVFVEDTSKELPALLSILNEDLGTIPLIAEPYLPPFDEVFVRLIQPVQETG